MNSKRSEIRGVYGAEEKSKKSKNAENVKNANNSHIPQNSQILTSCDFLRLLTVLGLFRESPQTSYKSGTCRRVPRF